jgi:hypothetical protein
MALTLFQQTFKILSPLDKVAWVEDWYSHCKPYYFSEGGVQLFDIPMGTLPDSPPPLIPLPFGLW